MVSTNPQIRQNALASLRGRWGAPILTAFIYTAISGVLAVIPGIACVSFLITVPIAYGTSIWFLDLIRTNDGRLPELATIFDGFKDYVRIFITLFLSGIYIILWTLLFVVPGIVKSLSYSMTAYILKDNPELEGNQAIELSMAMMEGHKTQLFLMQLNFLMWVMLSCFTFGIGLLWVIPYIYTTSAAFYQEVKRDYESRMIAPSVAGATSNGI